ncbi:DUF6234 family protein [Streptomyces racemochromogenes]|uniref:DUF6234 family protein n=1 Tax=Streptomyces racemochromogenes TaxID=67353 RepID=A0ABW7PAW6_9ACTN
MTHAPRDTPGPRPRRHWPWSRRTSTGADVTVAVLLFLLEAVVLVLGLFGHGMEGWAAQGDRERIEAAELAGRVWLSRCLVAVLVLAVVAMVSRARWTVVAHLLLAAGVAALLVLDQHDRDRSHPTPEPRPRLEFTLCLSGDRCD